MLVGSRVRAWTLVWPKGPQCRCLVWFREFVATCELRSEGVVPRMAQGPKLLVSAGVLEV